MSHINQLLKSYVSATCTRPKLAYVVSVVSRFSFNLKISRRCEGCEEGVASLSGGECHTSTIFSENI